MSSSHIDWPPHLDRTPAGDRRGESKYSVSLAKAVSDLETELDRIAPERHRVSFGNLHKKGNGMPRHDANPDDPGFVVYWTEGGTDYAVACDHYQSLRDNVREIGKWLKETRLRDNREIVTGGSNFAAAELPPGSDPDDDDVPEPIDDPYAVLGVHPEASINDVEAAFKRKAKATHPDGGGSDAEFKRIKRAYETILDEREADVEAQHG